MIGRLCGVNMNERKELENLDVAMNMNNNISLLLKVLCEVKELSDSEQDELMKIIEEKVLEIETYFYRPVDSREVYEKLSSVLRERGETKKADEFHTRIARMDSNLFEFKGRLHNFFGNNTKAMTYYKKSYEFWSDNESAQKGFVRSQNRVTRSTKQLSKIEKDALKRQDAKSFIKYGQALADLGRMDEALDVYSKALEASPSSDEAMVRKGTALESLNRFEEAYELFKKALEINPKSMIARRGINYADYYFTHYDSDYYQE